MVYFAAEYTKGWHRGENDGVRDFRWMDKSAEIEIFKDDFSTPKRTTATLNLGSPHDNYLCIWVDDTVVFSAAVKPGWTTVRFSLSACEKQTLRLEVEDTFQEGDRTLGIMVGKLSFSSPANTRLYLSKSSLTKPKRDDLAKPQKPFISVYYYLWYFTPEGTRSDQKLAGKWAEGYARAFLEPPQAPMLGEYVMNDPEVIETHIDWAADHGINCFICNWEGMVGHRKFLSENIVHILQGSSDSNAYSAGKIPYSDEDSTGNGWDAVTQGWHHNGYPINNLQRMKFSVLIESRLIVETWPPTADSVECLKAFLEAIVYMAENFFRSPQWQRIDNKPVVYLYEVYSWHGDKAAFSKFRESLDSAVRGIIDPLSGKFFEGIYLIADVVYPYPQDMSRLGVFDAVTGYQPYPPVSSFTADNSPPEWNYRGSELFQCSAFEAYHQKFADFCESTGVALIPTVIPKYNDRGVRGAIDNYSYPPGSASPYRDVQDARDGNLFKRNIQAQLRWVSPEVNMLNINSWNEWFEDTSIEPVGYMPDTQLPDYCNQGANVGESTHKGHNMEVPEKIVIYDHDGHTWMDTPPEIKEKGIDITQGFEWPCYGFDYLFAIKDYFGLEYSSENRPKYSVEEASPAKLNDSKETSDEGCEG